jgi:acetate kinase
MSHVLVVNSGSSTLKYQLVDPASGQSITRGLVDRIGQPGSSVPGHEAAVAAMLDALRADGVDLSALTAVGHRVVHGGSAFREPVIVDDEVERTIERMIPLAPLHNPAGLMGIRLMRRLLPDIPQVAVFDTAFHATMPPEAFTYAIPSAVSEDYGIRRYGFHGTSYQYVTRRAAEFLGLPVDDVNLIIAHLGNGASMAAIRGGHSIDTSMGMTPLEGLVMGTRSGDIDPGVIFHLVHEAGLSVDDVDRILNKESGLAGLAGEQDMRAVRALAEGGDARARLALDVYGYRIRAYVGAYLAAVPSPHALVFTAGIGENDAALRSEVCHPLRHLGLHLDDGLNAAPSRADRTIDAGTGPIRILVIPTDEEAEIARQAAHTVRAPRP